MRRRDLLAAPLAVAVTTARPATARATSAQPASLDVADFTFDGPLGSEGATVTRVGADHFRIALGAAPNQPGWPNKLNARILRNARGRAPRLDVVFPQGKDYAFNEYHQSFSYDGVHWHPLAWERGYLASPLADTLQLPPLQADQVWIGTQTPLSWDVDALGHIARWRQHPDVTVHTVGKTLGGRDMLRLEITASTSPHPRSRRWVHYFANQHPGEHNSQWRLVGLVDWLLSDAGADVRARQIVHVVLMMSPDAPSHGWYRVNAQGVDMNRSYSPAGASTQQAHEAYVWQRDLEGLMASGAPVTTIWAIHTWSGIVEPQLIPGPELQGGPLGDWTALRQALASADRLGLIEAVTLAKVGQYENRTWTDGPHKQFGITAMLCEGGAVLQTRQLNEASGAAIIQALGRCYAGVKPPA
ncbi:M14 family zinc carboxypeptidase [Luteitalea sp.]|jgi:hypothetical protein|uniref:M14 family zinc carboxypeptidase n=1 Tax=Luteitalea sp. TaxID=2004800 RepID=UPI0037C8704A